MWRGFQWLEALLVPGAVTASFVAARDLLLVTWDGLFVGHSGVAAALGAASIEGDVDLLT